MDSYSTRSTTQKRCYRLFRKNGKVFILHLENTATYEHNYQLDPESNIYKYLGKVLVEKQQKIIKKYCFSPISREKVKELRKKGQYAIIVKSNNEFYALYERPGYLNFCDNNSIIGKHKCATCERLSACSDPKGCKKVRDINKCIEDYEFVDLGLQILNGPTALLISECQHYEEFHPPKKVSNAEYNKMKLALAQYIYPYIRNLSEIPRHRYSYVYSDDYLEQFLHKSSYNTYY